MNTLQILAALESIPANFKGVYPADQIPRIWARPAALVFNTDDHNKPGTHWVAIYVNKEGRGLYFDSYGYPPIIKKHAECIRRNCTFFEWNTFRLQNEASYVCGHYCIMFLHFMSSGLGSDVFINLFTTDLYANDRIVEKYYKSYVNKNVSNATLIKHIQYCSKQEKNIFRKLMRYLL